MGYVHSFLRSNEHTTLTFICFSIFVTTMVLTMVILYPCKYRKTDEYQCMMIPYLCKYRKVLPILLNYKLILNRHTISAHVPAYLAYMTIYYTADILCQSNSTHGADWGLTIVTAKQHHSHVTHTNVRCLIQMILQKQGLFETNPSNLMRLLIVAIQYCPINI